MTDGSNKLAFAQWVFEKQLGWNASAEIKTGVIVRLNLAMISGLAALFIETSNLTATDYAFTSIALICSLITLGIVTTSVSPQLYGPKDSLLYFGRIGEKTRETYIEEFNRATEADLFHDVLEQT